MKRYGAALLCLVALAAAAETDPFAPPQKGKLPTDVRARVAESLSLMKATLAGDPAHLFALERATQLRELFGGAQLLMPAVRKGLETDELDDEHRAALRGLLGHLLVLKGRTFGWGNWINIRQARGLRIIVRGGQRNPQAAKAYREAIDHLRVALKADPTSVRTLEDLAEALEGVLKEGEDESEEASKLRTTAMTIRFRDVRATPEGLALSLEAERMRGDAEKLEQADRPDHGQALLLRKKALVLDFCSHSLPFEYEPALYGPVALLADAGLIHENLSRTYLKRSGEVDSVEPLYYAPSESRRRGIIEGLALDRTAGSAAALVAILRRATAPSLHTQAAIESLLNGGHPAVREHLPALLGHALFSTDPDTFAPYGQRLLVELAGALKLQEAGPVLSRALREETDLYLPRGIAGALARIGRAEDAGALLAVAKDRKRDVYFRRQAVDALGRFAPERLEELEGDPLLEISVAAGRYRNEPAEATRGRILAGIGREHEVDEAARYCSQLSITDAIPLLEAFLETRKNHYAAVQVRQALKHLKG